jgi:hypothetical protein
MRELVSYLNKGIFSLRFCATRSAYLHEYLLAYNWIHVPNGCSLGKSHESTTANDLFFAGI